MNPWARVNLVLAAVALVLLALELWPRANGEARLTALPAEEIGAVRVERGQRLTLALERRGDAWWLTHPSESPARPERVEQLLAITRAPVNRSFSPERPLAEYGLAPPLAVLQVDGLRIGFGARDNAQRQRYALLDGRVQLVDDLYFKLLTMPVRHFMADAEPAATGD